MSERYTSLNVALLASGTGSTVNSIITAVENGILDINIKICLTNNSTTAEKLKKSSNITYSVIEWNRELQSRTEYDIYLAKELQAFNIDLVVLAGWNHVVSAEFINAFNRNVINLHPSLPNTFVGMDCIRRAYEAYQRNEITHTGSMVHYVDEGIDTGKVISTIEIPIYDNDTYEDLETRQKRAEKGLLISAIQQ